MRSVADIKPMTQDELETVLDWAAQEGWNPGLDDASAFLAADPAGFLLKRVNGTPVAAISVVNHAPDFAFLGLYLCRPDYRGQGHGWSIWQAGIAHAGDRTIGLDGVPAQQANYEKSGFVRSGKTTRFTGQYSSEAPGIRPLHPEDLPHVLAQDRRLSGIVRNSYLNAWFQEAPTRRTLVHGAVGAPDAIVTIRQCREGAKIGPLRAPSAEQAMALIGACSDGQTVSIDVPDSSPALAQALLQAGFTASFETARMYRGPAPSRHPCVAEAVTTLELG